jgi:hypothetical protein
LGDCISQQNHILVEGFYLALEFDAVDQVNGHWHMLSAQCVEEGILQKLPFVVHDILRVLNCFKGFTLTHREAQNV